MSQHSQVQSSWAWVGPRGIRQSIDGGAVYVFQRSAGVWAQEAYLRCPISDNTLAIGAYSERSNATGVGGKQGDNSADRSGAVYLFTRTGTVWAQESYLKASNTNTLDEFGTSVALSGDTALERMANLAMPQESTETRATIPLL